jgi:alcohol dehydrogenase YqhD (iron-dependent ADH family)
MTEDERAAGRWQGNIDARLKTVERATGNLPERVTKLESRQNVMWSALTAVTLMLVGGAFKLWSEGGF